LTVEPDTAFGRRAARGSFVPVSDTTYEEEFRIVHDTLCGAGFEHYEISNFARAGFRARHNAAYWHGVSYLGIGPAAHSYNGDNERHWNIASVARYIEGAPAEYERLSETDRYNECLLTRLRTVEGISLAEMERTFGHERIARLLQAAEPSLQSGALRLSADRLAMPPEYFLVSDTVICSLFETEEPD
ncbi:MAG: coproporphyrinogen III oxidase family protein, partial [Alistipes sp.]|nr:coproporphyrinogen III oxidase family protein [Alistipes sp.]